MLIGRPGEAVETVEVVEAVRVRNIADNPDRFVLDPQGHIDARRAARSRGLVVLGFYHSHPHSEPEPSPTDLAEASYPDHLYLIVRPLPEGARIRLFRYDGSSFVELGFAIGEISRTNARTRPAEDSRSG